MSQSRIGQADGELLIVTGSQVRELLQIDPLLVALETAFVALSQGRSHVPTRVAAVAEQGMLIAMPGYLPGQGTAVKAITVYPHNHERGRRSHQGLIVLFDDVDGRPLCLIEAAEVTALRTAAASALSVRLLAPGGAGTLAILGSGTQAASHLKVVGSLGGFQRIQIASRDPSHARQLAATDPRASAVSSFEDAVRGAQVVCCCTDADQPVLHGHWIEGGCHVVSIGLGQELGPELVGSADLFAEWRGSASNPPPAGAKEFQGVDPERISELGEVLTGLRAGRLSDQQVTVYKSTGHAVEDVAAARLIYDSALQVGIGQRIAI